MKTCLLHLGLHIPPALWYACMFFCAIWNRLSKHYLRPRRPGWNIASHPTVLAKIPARLAHTTKKRIYTHKCIPMDNYIVLLYEHFFLECCEIYRHGDDWRIIIEDACGEYRRPFLSEGPFEETLTKIEPGSLKNRAREAKNGGPEGVWEVSWAIFLRKISRRRSWPI